MQRLASAFAATIALSLVGVDDARANDPHPALTPYPGSEITRRDDEGHAAQTVVVGVNPDGGTDEDAFETLSVEGVVTRLSLDNPKVRSAGEIFANYKEALESADFDLLYDCQDAACGPTYARSRWNRVLGLGYANRDMGYLAAKGDADGREIYVLALVAPMRHQIVVVEVAEMERGLVSAQAIASGLLAEGRVVLDGLNFDTDKTDLLPTSDEALRVIAGFLNENAALNVYIVGHTDATGGFDHNMALSRGRAAAVVKALTDDYGIDAGRLTAHGVGPLAPARSNKGPDGRAENRRVEMVER
ncbi:MAG: OmpA family protein [Parvularculaceae bacterium]